jgi:hypothetical protein
MFHDLAPIAALAAASLTVLLPRRDKCAEKNGKVERQIYAGVFCFTWERNEN